MDWNKNEWQGRSKRQVETSQLAAGLSIILAIITVIGLLILKFFTK